ncbi:hypothetical protein RRG08_005817 [Elysia crispata]|uniref:Uncharacterized protein n=1 Tax=Elysia crispata TaxID=231223 RepID=A0AAE0ZL69_9GAST|nr:hypothetical protein RRG08_005817 [Elysia crispata]
MKQNLEELETQSQTYILPRISQDCVHITIVAPDNTGQNLSHQQQTCPQDWSGLVNTQSVIELETSRLSNHRSATWTSSAPNSPNSREPDACCSSFPLIVSPAVTAHSSWSPQSGFKPFN